MSKSQLNFQGKVKGIVLSLKKTQYGCFGTLDVLVFVFPVQRTEAKEIENVFLGVTYDTVAEPISESTPQMNFSLMRASSDNQRQWNGQRGKVTNQQEW